MMGPHNSEVVELRKEVLRQWLVNHGDNCGAFIPPWPHEGDCQWPMPEVLAALSPNEVLRLLLAISEES